MNINTTTNEFLHGRLDIYTSKDYLDEENIIDEVNRALGIHCQNLLAEEYLYWYRRGIQPILKRSKERNTYICNKVVENHADEIVAFKNGYFLTKPAFYVSRVGEDKVNEEVKRLNEYLYRSGKQDADNEVVDWFHTVGVGYLFVKSEDDSEIPYRTFALDPRSTFVVKSLKPSREVVFACNVVIDGDIVLIDCYTKDKVYRLSGTKTGQLITPDPNNLANAISVLSVEPNPLGLVPIFEYKANSVNMGSFENVISLMDTINSVQSNRLDAIEQAIQSLLVFYNCELGEDENGNPNTTDKIKELGAVFLKSVGENKADIKEIATNLNQEQTQVLVNYLYSKMLNIAGVPNSENGSGSQATGSAVLARDGWYQADTCARNTEDLFRKSNREFDKAMLRILKGKNLVDLNVTDFDLSIARNDTANSQAKAQTLNTLLASGLAPEIAFAKSGISCDPVADVAMSEPYLKLIWGDPNEYNAKNDTGKGESIIVEADENRGNDSVGGAV